MAFRSRIMISVVVGLSSMAAAIPEDSTKLKISTGLEVVPSTLVVDGQYCAWIQLNQDNNLTLMRYDAQSTRTIATVSNDVTGLSCSNGNLAWIESGNVKFFDSQSVRQLSSGQKECISPQIKNESVLWYEGNFCDGYQLMFFNGQSIRQIDHSGINILSVEIENDTVVWIGTNAASQLVYFDGQTSRIVDTIKYNTLTSSSNQAAWYYKTSKSDVVMFFDGQVIRQISMDSNESGVISNVFVLNFDNGQVAWSETLTINTGTCITQTGSGRIMFFNGQSTIQLSNHLGVQFSFSTGKLVWVESGLISKLLQWDGSSSKAISQSVKGISISAFDGRNMLWREFPDGYSYTGSGSGGGGGQGGGGGRVSISTTENQSNCWFLNNGNQTYRLADIGENSIKNVHLYQNGVVWAQLDDAISWQIYLVEPNPSGVSMVSKADITGDGIVDLSDFSVLAESWLLKTELPPPDDYIAHWSMDDYAVDKTVLDAGDNHLDGAAQQKTAALTTAGKIGKALSFNGTTDWIDCGTNAALVPDAWTVCAWVKCTDTATPILFSFGGNYPSIKLQNNSKGKPLIHLGQNSYRYFAASAWTTLKDGQWHHVAFSVPGKGQADVNQALMYLDGVAVAGDTPFVNGSQASKRHVYLVANPTVLTQRFGGTMDDVMLFNRVLSATEINRIKNRIP